MYLKAVKFDRPGEPRTAKDAKPLRKAAHALLGAEKLDEAIGLLPPHPASAPFRKCLQQR